MPSRSLPLVTLALSALGLAATGVPAPGAAQPVQTAPVEAGSTGAPVTGDAATLADKIRLLATNPEDLPTLIEAGELAIRVGDLDAAEGLFVRAERIAPADRHLFAARAVLFVQRERPGEALRLFAEAEAAGQDMTPYLNDRALAYDLTGDQPRAQRDYRALLKAGDNDEARRRYALSLAISGKRDAALDLLDPLVRRSDRAGWRARVFVLAMTGDLAGAHRIAASMLTPVMAAGLEPFFVALPDLGPADRAFAVHFGELRPSPARLADARLAPKLPPLPPEPGAGADPGAATKRSSERRAAPSPPTATRPAPVHAPAAPPLPPPLPQPLPPPPSLDAMIAPGADARPFGAVPASAALAVPAPVPPKAPPSRSPKPPPGAPERPSETVSPDTPRVPAPPRRSAPADVEAPDAVAPSAPRAKPDKRAKPAKPDPAKAEPARIWVQVAGGANRAALTKAWAATKAKEPAAFRGKTGWTTTVRATNRVLTGPFKTRDEAQAFVNRLTRSGIAAFVVESEAGQKVTKLDEE